MLYVQSITLRYEKNVRYASYANQRRSVRFWTLPQTFPAEDAVFFHKVFLEQNTDSLHCCQSILKSYSTDILSERRQSPFSKRIAIAEDADSFQLKYGGRHPNGIYKTKMTLRPGEYGRIIFNERGMYLYDGIWYYDLTIYNFVNAPYSDCRQKLFFRKEPDYAFQDLQNLSYCGQA